MRVLIIFLSIGILLSSAYGEVDFSSEKVAQDRREEGLKLFKTCKRYIKFYDLKPEELYRDITEELLASSDLPRQLYVRFRSFFE